MLAMLGLSLIQQSSSWSRMLLHREFQEPGSLRAPSEVALLHIQCGWNGWADTQIEPRH